MFTRTMLVALAALFATLTLGGRGAGAITESEGRTRIADQAELTRQFYDRTFYGRYADNSNFTEYYAPDGRAGYWDGCPHAGKWWVEQRKDEAVVCFLYPTMSPAGPHCFGVFRAPQSRGARLEFLLDGSDPRWNAHGYTLAIRPGNPEGLSLTASGCQISQRFQEEKNG
jgi:hypothetical protein